VNRTIGSSLVVTKISSYTLKITVTVAHVTSHAKPSNSSSGHTTLPSELRDSSEVNSRSCILSYPLGTDHAQKTQFYYCAAQTTQKTSHIITISPVHWRADCCLAMSYKHSSYCCVRVSRDVYRAVAWQCLFIYLCIYILHVLYFKELYDYALWDARYRCLCASNGYLGFSCLLTYSIS
jgi:hypothetical protein